VSIRLNRSPASLPSRLLLAAFIAALFGSESPALPSDVLPATEPAAAIRAEARARPALYTCCDGAADEQGAWDQLKAAMELVRTSQAVLEEAQSLRAIAGALWTGSAEAQAGRDASDTAAGTDGARSQRELAAGQLAVAEKLLQMAQADAEIAQVVLNIAWRNALRARQENAWPDQNEPLRQSRALDKRRSG